MKRLIILTHHYPYNPPKEQFLHTELPYLQRVFEQIVIIPIARDVHEDNHYSLVLKKSIESWVTEKKSRYREFISGGIKTVFDANYLRSCLNIMSNRKVYGERPILQLFQEYVQAHA